MKTDEYRAGMRREGADKGWNDGRQFFEQDLIKGIFLVFVKRAGGGLFGELLIDPLCELQDFRVRSKSLDPGGTGLSRAPCCPLKVQHRIGGSGLHECGIPLAGRKPHKAASRKNPEQKFP